MLRQMLLSTILIGSTFTTSLTAFGTEYGSPGEAKAMLGRAIVAVKSDKLDAIARFNNNDVRYRDRDLFVFCFNTSDGKFTAHEALVGQDAKRLQDSMGKRIGKEFYKDAREDEITTVPFVAPWPGSTRLAAKIAFVTREKDQICGVSAYLLSNESGQSSAAFGAPMPPEFNWKLDEPIIRKRIIADAANLKPGQLPTADLLTSIVTWISNSTDTPANYSLPRLEREPNVQLASMRHDGEFVSPGNGLGGYDETTKTILLPSEWTAATPGELSILVHQMVYHLQNVGGQHFQCSYERESRAYVAQDRWLAAFGSKLEIKFGVDPEAFAYDHQCPGP